MVSYRSAAAVLLAVGLISLTTASPSQTVDKPQWTVGDFWTYQTNTTLTPGLNLTGPVTSSVAGRETIVVHGVAVDAYRLLVSGSGTASGTRSGGNTSVSLTGSWILTGEELVEPDALNIVSSVLDLSVNGSFQLAVPIPFSLRVQNTTTFRILQDTWQYPLQVGGSGEVAMQANYTQDIYGLSGAAAHTNGTAGWNLTYSLGAAVSVPSAAGTFSAFPIRETWPDGSYQRLFYAPNVGYDVRTESYAADGNLTAVTSLLSYRYQALEPTTFLGLTGTQWAILAAVVAFAAAATALWVRRRRRRRKATPVTESPPGAP